MATEGEAPSSTAKKVWRVLSIDFDYYLDTTLEVWDEEFPPGGDNIPPQELKAEWQQSYQEYPQLRRLGLRHLPYAYHCHVLHAIHRGKAYVADSHGEIVELLKQIPRAETLELTHIDFHHDNYVSAGSKVDCANWVHHLQLHRDPENTHVTWIRRLDSEMASLYGPFPYPNTTDYHISSLYDYVFLCFSPEWTPPHLRGAFQKLVQAVKQLHPRLLKSGEKL